MLCRFRTTQLHFFFTAVPPKQNSLLMPYFLFVDTRIQFPRKCFQSLIPADTLKKSSNRLQVTKSHTSSICQIWINICHMEKSTHNAHIATYSHTSIRGSWSRNDLMPQCHRASSKREHWKKKLFHFFFFFFCFFWKTKKKLSTSSELNSRSVGRFQKISEIKSQGKKEIFSQSYASWRQFERQFLTNTKDKHFSSSHHLVFTSFSLSFTSPYFLVQFEYHRFISVHLFDRADTNNGETTEMSR